LTGELAGLYVHVPFCRRVCPYCDFAVRTGDAVERRRFTDNLLAEIELHAGSWPAFDTVYFGGGTPSHLAADELARVVEAVRERFGFTSETRIFLEANPEDVTRDALDAWRQLGVATLSLGVQSLDASRLRFLGRLHTPPDAREAVEAALAAGFLTVSIDLIYGLPGQTAEQWRAELEEVCALGVQHVSCYQLTIHERTRFGLLEARGELRQLPVEDQAELFLLTHRQLNAAGFEGYEVSSFAAAPEHRSRHNIKYWQHTPYLGIGPSAHSFRDAVRWWNLRRTSPWEQRIAARQLPIEQTERLDGHALALEALMVGLRTYAGVDLERIRSRFGVDVSALNAELIDRLAGDGMLTVAPGRLVPTLAGLAVADGLAGAFEVSRAAPGS
jgi:oxygen-independent coproporphyrinogen-3 oxidase